MKQQLNNERWKLLSSLQKTLEGPMVLLGFIWLMLIVIDLTSGLPTVLQQIANGIWIIFIIDFLLRLLLAPAKWRFIKRNWLTAVSLIVPAIRLFRLVRVFRLMRSVRLVKVIGSLNRSMRSLSATMSRRGFLYVVALTVIVMFAGAAGMYAIEKGNPGFTSFGLSLWWTSMRIITAGSDFWPITAEGRFFAFMLSLFGYAIFGYVTATLATFFIGRDAEEKDAPVAGAQQIDDMKSIVMSMNKKLDEFMGRGVPEKK